MAYQVALLNFEGPLDLLMQLIERSEVSITEIPLSSVTEQYLSYINQLDDLDPLELNRFIDLASRLIYAKSRALLPGAPANEDEDGQLEELGQQLERYQHYRKAAAYLEELFKRGRSWQRPVRPETRTPAIAAMNLELEAIQQAFEAAMASQPSPPERVELEPVPTMEEVAARVEAFAKAGGGSLQDLFATTAAGRTELVLTFVTVLELIKSRRLEVKQSQTFGQITVLPL